MINGEKSKYDCRKEKVNTMKTKQCADCGKRRYVSQGYNCHDCGNFYCATCEKQNNGVCDCEDTLFADKKR